MSLSQQDKKIILLAKRVRRDGDLTIEGGREVISLRNRFYALRRLLSRTGETPELLEELNLLTFSRWTTLPDGKIRIEFRNKLPIDSLLDNLTKDEKWEEKPEGERPPTGSKEKSIKLSQLLKGTPDAEHQD